jgi:hypothetical protein
MQASAALGDGLMVLLTQLIDRESSCSEGITESSVLPGCTFCLVLRARLAVCGAEKLQSIATSQLLDSTTPVLHSIHCIQVCLAG